MQGRRISARFLLSCALAGSALAAGSARAEGLDLQQYKGKVVLLDFWASWCAPCKESFPWMQRLQERYRDRGFVVVAVNVDHDPALAQHFLQAQRTDFPVVFDPKGQWAERYDVKNMPSSFYFDRHGTLRSTHAGFHVGDVDTYERELAALIAER